MTIAITPQPSAIEDSAVPRRRLDVGEYAIDGEAVLLDRRTNAMHLLNRTAWVVWSHCDGVSTRQRLSQALCDAFAVDRKTADMHVARVLEQLTDSNLLGDENPV